MFSSTTSFRPYKTSIKCSPRCNHYKYSEPQLAVKNSPNKLTSVVIIHSVIALSKQIMSPLFLSFLMLLSMPACNARYLGLAHRETRKQALFNKVLMADNHDQVNLHKISALSEMMPLISEKPAGKGQQQVSQDDSRSAHKSLLVGAPTMNQKNLIKALLEQQGTKGATSENKIMISLEQADLQPAFKMMEGLKRQGRSMLGSTLSDTEEAVESEENDIAEDVVVMDYAQPHRKPPIHNEKP